MMPRADLRPAPEAADPLLLALQLGDSFFPSGGSAFSWGLESLHTDGMAEGIDRIFGLLCSLIEQRWAGFDRPLLRAAYHAAAKASLSAGDPTACFDELAELDDLCEAMTLNTGARSASRRLGFTQLRVHGELGLAVASAYLHRVRDGKASGHLPVVQGLVWQSVGLSAHDAEGVSAFGLCTSVVGAAIRLGKLGHIDAQRLLHEMRYCIAATRKTESPSLDDLWTGTPVLEVAAMRHEPRSARLFAN